MDFYSIVNFICRVIIVLLLFTAVSTIVYRFAYFIGNHINFVDMFCSLINKLKNKK